jgi:hypothetical protein
LGRQSLDDRISVQDASVSRSLSRKKSMKSQEPRPVEADFSYQNEDTILNLVH